jgi:hypothetical protein
VDAVPAGPSCHTHISPNETRVRLSLRNLGYHGKLSEKNFYQMKMLSEMITLHELFLFFLVDASHGLARESRVMGTAPDGKYTIGQFPEFLYPM